MACSPLKCQYVAPDRFTGEIDLGATTVNGSDSRSRRFGDHGGQYVPEGLTAHLERLEVAFFKEVNDPAFWDEYRSYYDYTGRPGRVYLAERLTEYVGGANIWFIREDLNHTGSYKINNVLGQVLLARRMGKKKIITETGAGQHGVAAAAVCAKFGLECVVFVGANDEARQHSNILKMSALGARIVIVNVGTKTVRDAMTEALRAFSSDGDTSFYLAGAPTGPYPIPLMVRTFQSVIGKEAKEGIIEKTGRLPDAVVACVGAGANAIGAFYPFLDNTTVRLVGVEAAGQGIHTTQHSATLSKGSKGVFHGAMSYVLQDVNGQIMPSYSVAAGLDYPGVGPELSFWKDIGRAEFVHATDEEALQSFHLTCQLEGIIPALECAHAIHGAMVLAGSRRSGDVLVCISGMGDKDLHLVDCMAKQTAT